MGRLRFELEPSSYNDENNVSSVSMLANTKQETYVSNGRISVLAMGKKNIFLYISVQTSAVAPTAPYQKGTEGYFPGGRLAEA